MANLRFHSRTGRMVTLSHSNKRAQRNQPHQDFNKGLLLSSEPLQDDQLFEVRIDRKVPSWSGSIVVGITTLDPTTLEFPPSANNLREGSWVMSGTSILNDGKSVVEDYGEDLDQLSEGDRVGVMRSSSGGLHFFVNGVDQGEVPNARTTIPAYAVIDLYGKCAQVSIVELSETPEAAALPVDDELHFHTRSGCMIRFTNGNRTAKRSKPVDEFNNGVVMTHRPLKDNELFEIRIDELVQKWSGSIEMGITTHNPDSLDFPATMTNMRSGTIMMSGCGILTNGKGSKREYGDFNLDELHEGDMIGLMRKSNGSLHYYINGLDQGVAATNVPSVVYGVVDLYGMTVKVSICSGGLMSGDSNNYDAARLRPPVARSLSQNFPNLTPDTDRLFFHLHCGDHVRVVNGGRTALRPNSLDDFNHAVVLTSRPLKQGEFFQVVLEQVVTKWAGSIEIGVTTHSPHDLEFPSTMTTVRSGTWMMTGNGVMYNGTTTIDEYGSNLDNLKVADRVGLVVTKHGNLHFFVNGVDQGLAACNVPNGVYGVIDLYGQAAKASIVYNSATNFMDEPGSSMSHRNRGQLRHRSSMTARRPTYLGKHEVDHINESSKSAEPTFLFHPVCGRNVILKSENNMATRIRDFVHGVVFSSKPLENEGFFEIQVCTINTDWQGSLLMGLTNYVPMFPEILPEFGLKFVHAQTWLLFEGDLYRNGQMSWKSYAPVLRRLTVGDKLAVKKDSDGNLYYVYNGTDLGLAAENVPSNLYVICDLFASTECIRITQCNLPSVAVPKGGVKNEAGLDVHSDLSFHLNHGRNVELKGDNKFACRVAGYNHGLVMTNRSLKPNELFEVRVDTLNTKWTSSMRIGITNQFPERICLPIHALLMQRSTWVFIEDNVYHNGMKILPKYGPNLDNIKTHQTVGIKIEGGKLHLYINGKDQGPAADEIPFPCYGIVDLFGQCTQVSFSYTNPMVEYDSDKGDGEKADLENEKAPRPLLSVQLYPKICEVQRICSRIKTLIFPDGFFLPNEVSCFCERCLKSKEDEPFYEKGDPNRTFSKPVGWCRFGLKCFKAEKLVYETWHKAFHGVKLGAVREILDHQGLLPAEKLGLQRYRPVSGKDDDDKASSHVLMSPNLEYAGSLKFAPKARIVDPRTRKEINFHVAFQVFVRPGSYSVSIPQIDSTDSEDGHFSTNIEWYTKEEDSTILYGLLLRLADS